ncbi:hypothetical protein BpHYR1_040287 [Brachionus plicatilis]|uniref:Uncharacterized protein n=1 Tax=Brachionus plicatilis TaxID=10195 RepID=A0A3M7R8I4_BRAPC|nr:hypothetical protein BpHYR1_040287 [Brachionus plicatilis]
MAGTSLLCFKTNCYFRKIHRLFRPDYFLLFSPYAIKLKRSVYKIKFAKTALHLSSIILNFKFNIFPVFCRKRFSLLFNPFVTIFIIKLKIELNSLIKI